MHSLSEVPAMEIWVRIGRTKKKYQGSFRSVMESIVKDGKGKKTVQLLSFHAGKKERRRLKRELREHDKDLLKTASAIARWFYEIDRRKIKRRIKELKKRARYVSKGEIFYRPEIMDQVRDLENQLREIEKKLEDLKV
jgi:methyl-accepting chemotaxis protein